MNPHAVMVVLYVVAILACVAWVLFLINKADDQ